MADYADVAAVRLALSPNGDATDSGSAASLADTDLQAALDDATDEVNGKISGRYGDPVSISPVPTILTRITRDIAAYFATLTFRRGDPILAGDPVQLRYNAAESLLTQIQNGTLALGADTADGPDLLPLGAPANDYLLTYGESLPWFGGWYGNALSGAPCGPFGPQYP